MDCELIIKIKRKNTSKISNNKFIAFLTFNTLYYTFDVCL